MRQFFNCDVVSTHCDTGNTIFSARCATFDFPIYLSLLGKLVQEGAFGRMHVEHLTVSCATSCGRSSVNMDSRLGHSDTRSLGPSTLGYLSHTSFTCGVLYARRQDSPASNSYNSAEFSPGRQFLLGLVRERLNFKSRQ